MKKEQETKVKRPWYILVWLVLYLVNLILVIAFQYFFIHTYSAPLTAEHLTQIPYFSGCKILDIAGTLPDESSLKGKSDPNWILYEDNTGVVRAVRAEWNLYVPRFRIEKSSDTLIADEDKSYTFSARDFLGTNKVVVENRNVIASFESAGAYRQQSYIQTAHILTAFALLLLEGALMLCVEKRTKKRT